MTSVTLKPGTVVDGYEVVSLLGRGGMGAVYRVRRGDADYALKTLTLESDDGSEEVLRFRREAELLGALRHPGLVSVRSAGHKPGFFYFIMRLVEGESLEDRIKRTGALPPDEAARIMLAVAEAVAHAHERGVVHRDLKPANVLMDRESDSPIVTDFGLGRKLGESESERLTRTGEILGTPSYVAPEQAFGLKAELDEKTDVYGLGALLYALLAGRAPFDGPSALMVLKRVSTEPPPRLAGVSPELEAFVLRAMAKNRDERPPSAAAFAAELEAATSAPPLVSRAVLALVLVAALVLAATLGVLKPWRYLAGDLPTRVAALRASAGEEPLAAARATAARALDDVPDLVRRRFAHERLERGRSAFAARSWTEAREALLDAWLAAPEAMDETESLLAATLAEAAARSAAEHDEARATKLRDQARSASMAVAPLVKDALAAVVRTEAGELVAAASTSSAGWAKVLESCEAASLAGSALPEDGERARLAALVITGRADQAALADRPPDALRAPPLSLAAGVLYAAALARPDAEREGALRRLEKIPPPAPFDAPVSDLWWRIALETYEKNRVALRETVGASYFDIVGSKSPDKLDQAVARVAVRFATVFEPIGRALRAQPERQSVPEEVGELLTFVRIITNQSILMKPGPASHWKTLIVPLGEHPLALYIEGRLLVNRIEKPRAHWSPEEVAELRTLTRKLTAALQRAPRTEHVRTLAFDFMVHVLLDELVQGSPVPKPYSGILEDLRPLAELSNYAGSHGAIMMACQGLKDVAGYEAASKRWQERDAVHDDVPHYLSNMEAFLAHQVEQRASNER